jgi:hypothetical protein
LARERARRPCASCAVTAERAAQPRAPRAPAGRRASWRRESDGCWAATRRSPSSRRSTARRRLERRDPVPAGLLLHELARRGLHDARQQPEAVGVHDVRCVASSPQRAVGVGAWVPHPAEAESLRCAPADVELHGRLRAQQHSAAQLHLPRESATVASRFSERRSQVLRHRRGEKRRDHRQQPFGAVEEREAGRTKWAVPGSKASCDFGRPARSPITREGCH